MPLHSEKQFTEAYLAEYEAEAATPLGRLIIENRWQMVMRHINGGNLLDYGCGNGSFIHDAPPSFNCRGYDCNPYSTYNTWTSNFRPTILTLWDVIEHLRAPAFIFSYFWGYPEWVFISTPDIDSAPEKVVGWKHLKPGEHFYYFNRKSLTAMLYCNDYEVVECNFIEGMLRDPSHPQAIISIAARRKK